MIRNIIPVGIVGILISCSPGTPKYEETDKSKNAVEAITDPTKGIGQVKTVTLANPLDQERVKRGLSIYEMKCSACHRLDDQRVVGPGWKELGSGRAGVLR